MPYNVLILSSSGLPSGAPERRRLGLPGRPTPAGARWRARPGVRCARLEAVPARHAERLSRLMNQAGGRAELFPSRVLLLEGDEGAFDRLLSGARRVSGGPTLAGALDTALLHRDRPTSPLRLRRGRLDLRAGTRVMAVLNLTPDSFSDGGRYPDRRAAIDQALRMADEGADIIDVGGESTRPGSTPVRLDEELRRVLPVLEELVPRLARRRGRRVLISIDTTKAEVVRRAAALGVDMINDISGLGFDRAMPEAVARSGLPVVISHIRGRPRTMQRAPHYRHLLPDIARFLRRRIDRAVRAGVSEDRILIDPGIGFGKRRSDNLAILRHLSALRSIGRPILIGVSRKLFIGGALELPVSERLEGTLAAQALAIAGGADIIRVHDVRSAVRAARLCDAVLRHDQQRDDA